MISDAKRMEDSCFIENQLRFLSFALCRRSGIEGVEKFLSRKKQNGKLRGKISQRNLFSICKGIRAELEFYGTLGRKYHAVPALDIGCGTDFLGLVDGNIQCIDVTTSIESKRDKQLQLEYGALKWPYRLARVKDDVQNVRWYCPICNGEVKFVNEEVKPEILFPVIMPSFNVKCAYNFYAARYRVFVGLLGSHTDTAPYICSQTLNSESQRLLDLQIRFFKTFRYALNLMPMLSPGDGIDFIGQHGNAYECYHVIGEEKIWRHSFAAFEESSNGYSAKIVREVNGELRFEDPTSLSIFQPEEPGS